MVAAAGIAVAVGGAVLSSQAAKKAASTQSASSAEAVALGREGLRFQQELFDTSRADLSPYRATGGAALHTMSNMFLPGGQAMVQLQGRLNELRAQRAALAGQEQRGAGIGVPPAPLQQVQQFRRFGASSEGEGGPGGPGGGPDGPGNGNGNGNGNGGGGGGCFAAGSPILMADGSTKPIEEIEIGDMTSGGRVTGVMVFEGDHHAYDYLGVVVSGSHGVFENGMWMRVRDSFHGNKLPGKVDRWYLHDTTNHEIISNGVRFTDFHETEMDTPLQITRATESLVYLNEMERRAA